MPKSPDVTYPSLQMPATVYPSQDTRVLPRQIFASGTLPGNTVINLGDLNIQLDAKNRKLAVYDGTVEVVRIGLLADGSYGILVSAGSITGTTIKTAVSGRRVELDSTNGGEVRIYDTSGIMREKLDGVSINFYDENGVEISSLFANAATSALISTGKLISYDNVSAYQDIGFGRDIYAPSGAKGVSGTFSAYLIVEKGIVIGGE